MKESIQLGAKSETSVDVEDPNLHRKASLAGVAMELETTSGLITIRFRGQESFVHISACRQAFGLGTVSAEGAAQSYTKYDPNAVDDDDEPSPGNEVEGIGSHVTLSGPLPFPVSPDDDADEFEDPPVPPAPKKKPGRPKKAVSA